MTKPRHIAIVMDGNGRWAEGRKRPRSMGHKAGLKATRRVVEACGEIGVEILTLFAFSSENWRRPPGEVRRLLDLFKSALDREMDELQDRVRVQFIGDRSAFGADLQTSMRRAERLTRDNEGLRLVIAVNYGGRWDLVQAVRAIARDAANGRVDPNSIDEHRLDAYLSLAELPDPDLLIRTGGEKRVSNFLLWELAYTELYFSDVLWPDFDRLDLERAIQDYGHRQRRFGQTGEQLDQVRHA